MKRRVVVTTPPTVRGFSSESALQLELLDRSGGQLSLEEFESVAQTFIRNLREGGQPRTGEPDSMPASPAGGSASIAIGWLVLDLDYGNTLREIGTAIGGRYIDDTFEGNRIRSIVVQVEGTERSAADDLAALMVRNRQGELVSLANVVTLNALRAPTTSITTDSTDPSA